jgi:hypothetical protein
VLKSSEKNPAEEQKRQIHKIPLSVAENASAYLYPEKISTVSHKDRARLIYALSQYNQSLLEQNQQIQNISEELYHNLSMLLTPVSDQ